MNLDGITIESNVEVPMRDGTILRADVFRPAEPDGPTPVVLSRTCYDKTRADDRRVASALARAGFVAVVQDIRGRNASDGDWVWHLSHEGSVVESEDGYDTCLWAAELDGTNGAVGVWGHSYPGWLAWRMAAARPEPLRALLTAGFAPHTTDCTHGVFETEVRLRWQHRMAVSSRRRSGDTAFPTTVEEGAFNWDRLQRGKWLWTLPLEDVPDELFGPTAAMQRQYWEDIAEDFWRLDEIHPLVTVPTFTITGWWDRLNACAENFTGMVENGPQETESEHRLLIGPWLHDMVAFGDEVGPGNDENAVIRFEDVLIDWFDHHLRGRTRQVAPVRLMLINEHGWREADRWPLEEATPLILHLHSRGAANTPAGDGLLASDEPGDEPSDRYTYDPADPVLSLNHPSKQVSATDLRPLADRGDILVYQTGPLDADVVVAGRPVATLWVASDCVDTDFIVRLVEVRPDGFAVNVAQGMIRARYREGFDHEVPLIPDRPEELTIPLTGTGIRFRKGSRIRLDVTSSDFPNFDRNHNTGRPFQSDPDLRIANQTIFHDRSAPVAACAAAARIVAGTDGDDTVSGARIRLSPIPATPRGGRASHPSPPSRRSPVMPAPAITVRWRSTGRTFLSHGAHRCDRSHVRQGR